MLRTHTCGELRSDHINQTVTLSGWIQCIRDKGKLCWIDLRDRYGITQIVIEENIKLLDQSKSLGREDVLQVKGTVRMRQSPNPELATGQIEVVSSTLNRINSSSTPPFLIEDITDGCEELRMKYRYLDLRRAPMQRNLALRHAVIQQVRGYLNTQNFLEIETPILIKSTPGGACDFIVPSRVHPNEYYALPQSPQILKQLLMIGGVDRYYQIARCFRDEDLRSDRQPEFTQIDCELSFVEQEDILQCFEPLIQNIWKHFFSVDLPKFQRITYQQAIDRYGTDKPDLRLGMQFHYLSKQHIGTHQFTPWIDSDCIICICVPCGSKYSRKDLDKLTNFVKIPQNLAYISYNEDGTLRSSIDKYFNQSQLKGWCQHTCARPGDLLLLLSGEKHIVQQEFSALRIHIGKECGMGQGYMPVWVTDFPLLEWDEELERYNALHHPFTAPQCIKELLESPSTVLAKAYDLVMNGVEIAGGSIRIHDRHTQEVMFSTIGLSQEQYQNKFGFLLNALDYGAPPHGGIAFGLDRLCALIGGETSIRPFIAFPKNNAGRDVMIGAPSSI